MTQQRPSAIEVIGLSAVEVVSVDDSEVRFRGVDLVDGTPVIDIKPWVAEFDLPPGFEGARSVRSGGYEDSKLGRSGAPSALTAEELELSPGRAVTVLMKATEITLSVD